MASSKKAKAKYFVDYWPELIGQLLVKANASLVPGTPNSFLVIDQKNPKTGALCFFRTPKVKFFGICHSISGYNISGYIDWVKTKEQTWHISVESIGNADFVEDQLLLSNNVAPHMERIVFHSLAGALI